MGQAPRDTVWVRALARVVGRTLTFTGVTLPAEGTRLGIELEGDVLAGFSEIPEQDDTDRLTGLRVPLEEAASRQAGQFGFQRVRIVSQRGTPGACTQISAVFER